MIAQADSGLVRELRAAVNFNDRAFRVELLVLHYTGMQGEEAALDWLCRAESRVSCHYFVFSDGRIVQSVPESERAWHAGASRWRGMEDLNSRSIGIEIANPGHEFGYVAFADAQTEAVIALAGDIVRRNRIAARNVVAHSDIAPARKQDPGELFPWKRLFDAGVGLWVEPAEIEAGPVLRPGDIGADVSRLRGDLAAFGYPLAGGEEYDLETSQAVAAFQRHFRPALVDGLADTSTVATLARLLAAVDGRPAA